FRIKRKAVAGFCFHRRRAMPGNLLQSSQYMCGKFALPCRAHACNAGANAAAGFGNLFVSRAGRALFKINQARSRERGMRVRVYKARKNNLALAVDLYDLLSVLLDPRVAQSVA